MRSLDLSASPLRPAFLGCLRGLVALGALSSTASAIAQTNRPPMLARPLGPYAVAEGGVLLFTVTATDADGDALTFLGTGLPCGATFNGITGFFEWTPDFDQAGRYAPSFLARDAVNAESPPITVDITVTNTNRPPTLEPVPDFLVKEGERAFFVLRVDEPDGDALSVAVTIAPPLPESDRAFSGVTGAFDYVAPLGSAGHYRLIVTVSDSFGESGSIQVSLAIVSACDPPVILAPAEIRGTEGAELSFTLSVTDAQGQSVTTQVTGLPDADASLDPVTGRFAWPSPIAGDYAVTFHARNECRAQADAMVRLIILPAGCRCTSGGARKNPSDTFIALLLGFLGACAIARCGTRSTLDRGPHEGVRSKARFASPSRE